MRRLGDVDRARILYLSRDVVDMSMADLRRKAHIAVFGSGKGRPQRVAVDQSSRFSNHTIDRSVDIVFMLPVIGKRSRRKLLARSGRIRERHSLLGLHLRRFHLESNALLPAAPPGDG